LSGPSNARRAIAVAAAIGLGVLSFWSTERDTVVAPARVEATQAFTVRHAGDGRVRWTLTDGKTPGVGIRDDGLLQTERGDPISVRVHDALMANDAVESGQPLVEIHSSRMKEESAALSAELDARKADAALLEAGGRPERIALAQRSVGVARANLVDAQANQEHLQSLSTSGAGSRFAAEEATRRVRVREAELSRAQAAVEDARRAAQDHALRAAKARVEEVAARLDEAERRNEANTLKSPLSGTITHPGGDVVLSVLSDDIPVLQAAVPEMERGKIRVGDRIEFAPRSGNGRTTGTVLSIGSDTQLLGSQLVVWVVTSLDQPLPLGATGTVTIHCEHKG
jgi:biotin carboxyl carrier protein